MTDYRHNNKYYWHLPEVTSIKSNYRMIVYWTSCNFSGKCTFNCTIVKKIYKTFTSSVFSIAFHVVPSLEVIQKNAKRGERREGQIKALLN